jgi:hypothetical protein
VLVALLLGAMLAAGLAWQASRNARVNLNKSLLKEAELHIARGNTPQAIINAIDASADLPEQSVRKLSLAFNGNRLLAMAPSAGPDPDSPRIPAFSASGDLLASISRVRGRCSGGSTTGASSPTGTWRAKASACTAWCSATTTRSSASAPRGFGGCPPPATRSPPIPAAPSPAATSQPAPDREPVGHRRSPSADGRHGLCVLDLTLPGKVPLRRLLREGEIRGLSFSPDGTRLVTAATGGRSHVFDLSSGRMLLSLPADGAARATVQ